MPDYGTYEGHRIISDAAQKTADRIQRGFQFKKQNELDERKRKDTLEHIRDQGTRMKHLNTLTDKQVWEIGQMTPETIRNIRSQVTERDTLLNPRVKNILSAITERDTLLPHRVERVDAETGNILSTARARDEEEKEYTESQTRNIGSTITERDTLLPGRKEQIDATTGNIISQTDYRDDTQTPFTEAQTSGMIQSQEHQEHDFDRQKIDENKADLTENIRRRYYMNMSEKLDDLDIYDEDAGEFRGDAAALLVEAIDNSYPQDIAKLDPNGKLDLRQINDVADDVHKLYSTEAMNRVMSEVSKANLTKEQLQSLIESDPRVKGYFDAFYRQGLGVNQEGSTYGPLGEALGYGENMGLSRDEQFAKVDDMLLNIPHGDRLFTQLNDDGQVEIVEEDFFNNDEYTVKWDKGKPYIVGDDNNQIYLDEQDKLIAEFD